MTGLEKNKPEKVFNPLSISWVYLGSHFFEPFKKGNILYSQEKGVN